MLVSVFSVPSVVSILLTTEFTEGHGKRTQRTQSVSK